MRRWSSLFAFACAVALSTLTLATAKAEGTLINAPNRADILYDDANQLLYITSDSNVLRYQLSTGEFLPPIKLSGQLKGMDISPDGSTLAIADFTFNNEAQQNWIHLYNLNTGKDAKVRFDLQTIEGGTVSVAYSASGKILVSSQIQGSGQMPLRLYDPATDTTSIIGQVWVAAYLIPNASHKMTAIGEIGGGDFGSFRSKGDKLNPNGGAPSDVFGIGINSKGTLIAASTYEGTVIADKTLHQITTIGSYPGNGPMAAAFHPTKALVYFPWDGTSLVKIYSTKTWTQVGSIEFEQIFHDPGGYYTYTNGRTIISKDGKLLFATVDGGVRYVNTKGH
jgi:WD40 repeat protein